MDAVLRQADAFVGVPYVLHGEDPTGWDCLGLVRHLRLAIFGRQSPPWGVPYDARDMLDAERAAQKVEVGRQAWSVVWAPGDPGEPPAGSALLFRYMLRPSHVGLMLTHGQFIHCERGAATVIEPLAPRWKPRIIAAHDLPGPH